MKILIISDAWKPQVNGVVRTYEHLIPVLERQGHNIKVIGPSDFPMTMAMPGYKEIRLALFVKSRLSRMIKDYAPDTIHIATEGPLGIATQKYCLKHGLTFSTSYHTQFPEYVKKRVEKYIPFAGNLSFNFAKNKIVRFHNNAASVLVTTNSIKVQLEDWGIKTPIHEFTRGVDESLFYLPNAGSKPIHPDLKAPIALYVGRIAIEKSIEDFLDMEWSGSKIVVGQGPDEDMLKAKYPDVLFTGKKVGSDLADHYRSADLFVFPSKTDTFGMVLIEALACGLPVAAYPAPGPQDIITADYMGALSHDLGTAAKQALVNDDAHKQQRHDHIHAHYTWERAAEQFLTASPVLKQKEAA